MSPETPVSTSSKIIDRASYVRPQCSLWRHEARHLAARKQLRPRAGFLVLVEGEELHLVRSRRLPAYPCRNASQRGWACQWCSARRASSTAKARAASSRALQLTGEARGDALGTLGSFLEVVENIVAVVEGGNLFFQAVAEGGDEPVGIVDMVLSFERIKTSGRSSTSSSRRPGVAAIPSSMSARESVMS